MRRRTRSLIALAAAYGIMLAAVFGTLAAGQSAILGTSSICRTSAAAGDQAPAVPAQHDFGCCVGCCSGAAGLPVSAPDITAPTRARIGAPAGVADSHHLPFKGCPFARAPPLRV